MKGFAVKIRREAQVAIEDEHITIEKYITDDNGSGIHQLVDGVYVRINNGGEYETPADLMLQLRRIYRRTGECLSMVRDSEWGWE